MAFLPLPRWALQQTAYEKPKRGQIYFSYVTVSIVKPIVWNDWRFPDNRPG